MHLTTKVWWEHLRPEAMRDALHGSLDRLGTPYVDLYLIHWPPPPSVDHLRAALETLTALKEQGLARAIGVSNFPVALLRQAVEAGAAIACNQIEYHVLLDQSAVLDLRGHTTSR